MTVEQLILGLHHGWNVGGTDGAVVENGLAGDLARLSHRQAAQILDQHVQRAAIGLDGLVRVREHPLVRDFLHDTAPFGAIG